MAFIADLMDARVDLIACDNPRATRLTLHILAAVAEHERDMISARTKTAMAVAKVRDVKLGNPRPALAANGPLRPIEALRTGSPTRSATRSVA